MENKICIKCLAEVSGNIKKCKCGNRSFAFGDLKIENGKIVCKCGNRDFNNTIHMDFTDRAVNSLACVECGNVCGTEYYRDKEDMMCWV